MTHPPCPLGPELDLFNQSMKGSVWCEEFRQLINIKLQAIPHGEDVGKQILVIESSFILYNIMLNYAINYIIQ